MKRLIFLLAAVIFLASGCIQREKESGLPFGPDQPLLNETLYVIPNAVDASQFDRRSVVELHFVTDLHTPGKVYFELVDENGAPFGKGRWPKGKKARLDSAGKAKVTWKPPSPEEFVGSLNLYFVATVYYADGTVSDVRAPFVLSGGYGINHPPVATFTWTPADVKVGDAVYFDASSSYDPDQGDRIVEYWWRIRPNGMWRKTSGPYFQWHFSEAGTWEISLKVVDSRGAEAYTSQKLEVTR